MDSCMVFETGRWPARQDGTLQALQKGTDNQQINGERLRQADAFSQTHSFAVSSTILNPAFLAREVTCRETRDLLDDMRQPHSQLLAAHGDSKCLHIFDQTHMIWIAPHKDEDVVESDYDEDVYS
jgi:hypothetical protein